MFLTCSPPSRSVLMNMWPCPSDQPALTRPQSWLGQDQWHSSEAAAAYSILMPPGPTYDDHNSLTLDNWWPHHDKWTHGPCGLMQYMVCKFRSSWSTDALWRKCRRVSVNHITFFPHALLFSLLVLVPLAFLPLTLIIKRSMPFLKRSKPSYSSHTSHLGRWLVDYPCYLGRRQDLKYHWPTLYASNTALANCTLVWSPQEWEGFSGYK